MSCGHRHGSDPKLLWLWCRPAAAAPIRPLAWELPYAMGRALKKKKKKDTQKIKSIQKYTETFLIVLELELRLNTPDREYAIF